MHFHGPVPLNDPIYIQREFETRLVREVNAGHWVLLLGPRQHGKTSAFLRLRKTLVENEIITVLIDLQKMPPLEHYEDLVAWFAGEVADALNQDVSFVRTNDLSTALHQVLPEGVYPIVILIDEASNINNEKWRNAFFGQIRAISSDRASAGASDIPNRLRFVFAGTFRPERLVAEQNSPFNICERIDTGDFSSDDVFAVANGSEVKDAKEVADLIYQSVGGQPYLTQRLVHSAIGSDDPLEAVQTQIDYLKDGEDDHVNNLFRRVVSEGQLIEIVAQVLKDGDIANEAGNEDHRHLTVLGILRREGGRLRFRNRLFSEIAASSPQFSQGVNDGGQQAPIFPLHADAFSSITNQQLMEIAHGAQTGAVGAYRAGSNRLALAGFGTAMETVLIDFLAKQDVASLSKAASHCKQTKTPWYSAKDPSTWTLADLMRGARTLLGLSVLDIPENLRTWRNLIHPGASLKNYKRDEELAPEVHVASAQLQIILRDLP